MRTPQSCKLQSSYNDSPTKICLFATFEASKELGRGDFPKDFFCPPVIPKVSGELSNTKDYHFVSERLHSQGCHKRFRLVGYGYMQLVSDEWKIFPKIHTVSTSQY